MATTIASAGALINEPDFHYERTKPLQLLLNWSLCSCTTVEFSVKHTIFVRPQVTNVEHFPSLINDIVSTTREEKKWTRVCDTSLQRHDLCAQSEWLRVEWDEFVLVFHSFRKMKIRNVPGMPSDFLERKMPVYL